MTYTGAITAYIIVVVIVLGALFGIPYLRRERPKKSGFVGGGCQDPICWVARIKGCAGTTASALANSIVRSA